MSLCHFYFLFLSGALRRLSRNPHKKNSKILAKNVYICNALLDLVFYGRYNVINLLCIIRKSKIQFRIYQLYQRGFHL